MARVGIVIVTYNSEAEIGPCLDAALPAGDVIVVDNASSDGTLEQVRRRGVRVVANSVNRGFAAAVNQGIRAIGSDVVLMLNPDAVLRTSIEPLRLACETPEAGAVGGKLVGSDNLVQAGFSVRRLPTPLVLALEVLLINRLWPGNPVNWHYRCCGLALDRPAEVEQPAGAFLMFRRRVWEDVGGLDEQFYPVWFEDVDFCKRLRDRGYRVYYEPRSVAAHVGGHSIRKILVEKREVCWYGNLLRYGFKHFRLGPSRWLCLAVIVGSLFRMPMAIVLRRSLKPVAVYGRVMRLGGQYMLFGPGSAVLPNFS